jgi:hypothetical protein
MYYRDHQSVRRAKFEFPEVRSVVIFLFTTMLRMAFRTVLSRINPTHCQIGRIYISLSFHFQQCVMLKAAYSNFL